MDPMIVRTVRMLSEGMRVQLGFYLGRTAGRKLLQRYVVSVGGVNTNGISGPIYTEKLAND